MEEKNLESTILKGPFGTDLKVKEGDKVDFIDPIFYSNSVTKSVSNSLRGLANTKIGKEPYEILEIKSHKTKFNSFTLLKIKGEYGEETINKDFLTKYFPSENY